MKTSCGCGFDGGSKNIRFGAGAGAVAVKNNKNWEQVRLRVRSVKSYRLH